MQPAWQRTRELFDEDFYLAVYPDIAGADETPFSHYISKGWREGRNPSAVFDTRDYLRRHTDVRATGICPLKHFAEHGQAEGRKISPAAIVEPGLQRALDLFDEDFYLTVYTDVANADENPFAHYISKGWREGRNPSASFDTRDYLRRNPDVRAAGICPLRHYAEHGQSEGRKISPAAIKDRELHRLLDHFDESFYLASNPDVAQAGVDPFLHYVRTGWREGRDPSPHFDTRFYLQSNPSVAAGGECPLKHYALFGVRAGRLARGPIDVKLLTLDNAMPNRERDATRSQLTERSSLKVEELFARLVGGKSTVVVSISHDDYAENVGGVQNVVSDEQRALNAADIGYLHLSPARPLSGVSWACDAEGFETSVRLDGTKLGGFPLSEIIREFRRGTALRVERYLIVHHLAGFRPEDVGELALAMAPRETIFWAHDFFHLCANPTLMRNDVAFCGAPPGDSKACEVCVYGRERRQMQPRVAGLFDAVRPTMFFPSEGMRAFWRDRARLTFAGEHVAPLGRFRPVGGPARLRNRDALRVGFLGTAAYYKGWGLFSELAAVRAGDARYSFFYLGGSMPAAFTNIEPIMVRVTADNRAAMIDAVTENRIDVVVLCSLRPETFGYTGYEAVAGGAFLLTLRESGNICTMIETSDALIGRILNTEADVLQIFESGSIFDMIEAPASRRFQLSAGTAQYITPAPKLADRESRSEADRTVALRENSFT